MPDKKECIFFVVGAFGQALMSWDGGATQQSASAFSNNGWTAAEQGVVMGVDRFPGVVLTANMWGYVLGIATGNVWYRSSKSLVLMAIIFKCLASLIFGLLDPSYKLSMITCRLFMGIWEALFNIWILSWIKGHATDTNRETEWNNYVGFFAGVGNNVGMLMAGALSEKSLGATYLIQAAMLLVNLVAVACVSTADLSTRADATEESPDQSRTTMPSASDQSGSTMSLGSFGSGIRSALGTATVDLECLVLSRTQSYTADQTSEVARPDAESSPTPDRSPSPPRKVRSGLLDALCKNKQVLVENPYYRWVCMAFSCSYFVLTGFNCLWQNVLVDVWDINPQWASAMMCAINGVVGTFGLVKGTGIVGRSFENMPKGPERSLRCMQVITKWTLVCVISATCGAALMFLKAYRLVYLNRTQPEQGFIFGFMLLIMCFIVFSLNSIQGFLNTEGNVDGESQEIATSFKVLAQNLLGYGLGAYLPGGIISVYAEIMNSRWEMEPDALNDASYVVGMGCVFQSLWFLYLCTRQARNQLTVNTQSLLAVS